MVRPRYKRTGGKPGPARKTLKLTHWTLGSRYALLKEDEKSGLSGSASGTVPRMPVCGRDPPLQRGQTCKKASVEKSPFLDHVRLPVLLQLREEDLLC